MKNEEGRMKKESAAVAVVSAFRLLPSSLPA